MCHIAGLSLRLTGRQSLCSPASFGTSQRNTTVYQVAPTRSTLPEISFSNISGQKSRCGKCEKRLATRRDVLGKALLSTECQPIARCSENPSGDEFGSHWYFGASQTAFQRPRKPVATGSAQSQSHAAGSPSEPLPVPCDDLLLGVKASRHSGS